MKNTFLNALGLTIIIGLGTIANVHAATKDFSGSASFSAGRVSASNTKTNTSYNSVVNWKTSDQGTHKMWFRIRNSNEDLRGSVLIGGTGYGDTTFETDCKNGYYYYLWANREHIFNPTTYVTGTWRP